MYNNRTGDRMFIKNGKINDDLSLTIGIKYNQIKRDYFPNLEIAHFVDYLFNYKWKKHQPQTLSDAIVEVMACDADHIVVYLSNAAIISSQHQSLNDFDDLFDR